MYPSWFSTRPFSWIDRASSSDNLLLLDLGANSVPTSALSGFAKFFFSDMVDAWEEGKEWLKVGFI